jgi:hypothetical protein
MWSVHWYWYGLSFQMKSSGELGFLTQFWSRRTLLSQHNSPPFSWKSCDSQHCSLIRNRLSVLVQTKAFILIAVRNKYAIFVILFIYELLKYSKIIDNRWKYDILIQLWHFTVSRWFSNYSLSNTHTHFVLHLRCSTGSQLIHLEELSIDHLNVFESGTGDFSQESPLVFHIQNWKRMKRQLLLHFIWNYTFDVISYELCSQSLSMLVSSMTITLIEMQLVDSRSGQNIQRPL